MSRPSTTQASAAFCGGRSSRFSPRRRAATAIGSTPRMPLMAPSSDSSPTMTVSSTHRRVERPGCGQQPERDRQVERRARLAHIGRRQVDRDAMVGKLETRSCGSPNARDRGSRGPLRPGGPPSRSGADRTPRPLRRELDRPRRRRPRRCEGWQARRRRSVQDRAPREFIRDCSIAALDRAKLLEFRLARLGVHDGVSARGCDVERAATSWWREWTGFR